MSGVRFPQGAPFCTIRQWRGDQPPVAKRKPAQHPKEITELIFALREGLLGAFGDEIVGIYLFGSLTYGDFQLGRSDIDLVIVVRTPLTVTGIKVASDLHVHLLERFPVWGRRLETSYTPLEMFQESSPPAAGRPYWGEGRFYPAAIYGNEWLINNYLLREHGVALHGPPFALLCPPIAIEAVQQASRNDLLEEWQPKLHDSEWLDDPHYQSYLVLNLCRILHTL